MKKLVLLICLFAATAVQAQTKEETISWLKGKLEKCLFNTVRNFGSSASTVIQVELTDCEMIIEITAENPDEQTWREGKKFYGKSTIPLSSFYLLKDDEFYRPRASLRSTAVNFRHEYYTINHEGKKIEKNETLSYSVFVELRLCEENILERITKAVAHLKTFCPQKKEAF